MSRRAAWIATSLFIAAVAAVISYRDGLFVARLAGNHDRQAYLYPFLPDGLIVICLLALYEAARTKAPRSGWASAGLVLGIALTLAQNIYAGLAHSVLDAVLDGMVPVVFFIAAEVVLWHVRRGRAGSDTSDAPATPSRSVPSGNFEAAKVSMAATAAAGNALSRNQLQTRFRLSRAEADEIWQPYKIPAGAGALPREPVPPTAPAGAHLNGSVR